MNIVFVADVNSPHTSRWIDPLIDRGYAVSIFSYAPVNKQSSGAEVVDLTLINNTPKLRFLVWAREIRRRLKKDRPDLLHAHQVQAAGWLGGLADMHPFVLTAWGSDLLVNPFRSRLSRFLTMRTIASCDILTLPSKHMYEMALSLGIGASKMRFIPWGIDPEPFRPRQENRVAIRSQFGLSGDDIVVLSPRGMRMLYNHDIVIEAVAKLLADEPRLKLVFIRPNVAGQYVDKLASMVQALGIDGAVRWIPYQRSMADLGRVYRMSDVVVSVPSSEGYGFTVFESLAAGTSTLISDLPVYGQVLEDGVNTVKVPVGDAKATELALWSLISDANLRSRLRRRGLETEPYTTIEDRVEKTVRLYKSLARQV